jgi:hypothetical protein
MTPGAAWNGGGGGGASDVTIDGTVPGCIRLLTEEVIAYDAAGLGLNIIDGSCGAIDDAGGNM